MRKGSGVRVVSNAATAWKRGYEGEGIFPRFGNSGRVVFQGLEMGRRAMGQLGVGRLFAAVKVSMRSIMAMLGAGVLVAAPTLRGWV